MMGRFRRFINDQALKEIPLHGRHLVKSACNTNLGQVRQSALYSGLGGSVSGLLAPKHGY
jgi:hypothetical protein